MTYSFLKVIFDMWLSCIDLEQQNWQSFIHFLNSIPIFKPNVTIIIIDI
jgi:hypothetical protein